MDFGVKPATAMLMLTYTKRLHVQVHEDQNAVDQ
jgi:hypothetical protein